MNYAEGLHFSAFHFLSKSVSDTAHATCSVLAIVLALALACFEGVQQKL